MQRAASLMLGGVWAPAALAALLPRWQRAEPPADGLVLFGDDGGSAARELRGGRQSHRPLTDFR